MEQNQNSDLSGHRSGRRGIPIPALSERGTSYIAPLEERQRLLNSRQSEIDRNTRLDNIIANYPYPPPLTEEEQASLLKRIVPPKAARDPGVPFLPFTEMYDPEALHAKCRKPLVGCRHLCQDPRIYKKTCSMCTYVVDYERPCGHKTPIYCGMKKSLTDCNEKCNKELKCSHRCTEMCHFWLPCPTTCGDFTCPPEPPGNESEIVVPILMEGMRFDGPDERPETGTAGMSSSTVYAPGVEGIAVVGGATGQGISGYVQSGQGVTAGGEQNVLPPARPAVHTGSGDARSGGGNFVRAALGFVQGQGRIGYGQGNWGGGSGYVQGQGGAAFGQGQGQRAQGQRGGRHGEHQGHQRGGFGQGRGFTPSAPGSFAANFVASGFGNPQIGPGYAQGQAGGLGSGFSAQRFGDTGGEIHGQRFGNTGGEVHGQRLGAALNVSGAGSVATAGVPAVLEKSGFDAGNFVYGAPSGHRQGFGGGDPRLVAAPPGDGLPAPAIAGRGRGFVGNLPLFEGGPMGSIGIAPRSRGRGVRYSAPGPQQP